MSEVGTDLGFIQASQRPPDYAGALCALCGTQRTRTRAHIDQLLPSLPRCRDLRLPLSRDGLEVLHPVVHEGVRLGTADVVGFVPLRSDTRAYVRVRACMC